MSTLHHEPPAAAPLPDPHSRVRFGVFELDARAHELRKKGVRVRLAEQPFQVLELLLERRGQLVTRQELQQRLWPADTFVDFELSLNSAVRKLREALGDSAEQPRYIETVPRRGYRFIAPIEVAASDGGGSSDTGPATQPVLTRARMVAWGFAGLLVLATLVLMPGEGDTSGSPGDPRPPAVDREAYALFLKGIDALGRVSYAGNLAAASYFEQAIARQPDYAQAYERLAGAHLQHVWAGPMAPCDVVPRVRDAALEALARDDTLVEAHRILATASRLAGDHARADAETRRAIDLASAGESLALRAAALMRSGHVEQAVAAADEASKLDPRSVGRKLLLAATFRAAGQFDRAVTEVQYALQLDPGRPTLLFQLGATYVLAGEIAAGIETLEDAVARSDVARFKAYLAAAYARAGRHADAKRLLQELVALGEHQYISSFGLALIHDALGDRAAALAALERASSECAVEFTQLDLYPPFQTLASDPRYQQLMQPGLGR